MRAVSLEIYAKPNSELAEGMMDVTAREVIYRGNSVVTVETLPDHSQRVVTKKPSKTHASRRHVLSLQNEYEMTRSLDKVEGMRRAIEKLTVENQPLLVLEYIDGETLQVTTSMGTSASFLAIFIRFYPTTI